MAWGRCRDGILRPDAFTDTGRSALSESDRFAQDDKALKICAQRARRKAGGHGGGGVNFVTPCDERDRLRPVGCLPEHRDRGGGCGAEW